MDRWENKIRQLMQFFRGWAKNMSDFYKKEKDRLNKIIDELNVKNQNHAHTFCRDGSKERGRHLYS
jgi:hypothetical protein